MGDQVVVTGAARNLGVAAGDVSAVLDTACAWKERLQLEADSAAALKQLLDKVKLKQDGIELSVNLPVSVERTHGAAAMVEITRFLPMRTKRRVVEMRLIIEGSRCRAA